MVSNVTGRQFGTVYCHSRRRRPPLEFHANAAGLPTYIPATLRRPPLSKPGGFSLGPVPRFIRIAFGSASKWCTGTARHWYWVLLVYEMDPRYIIHEAVPPNLTNRRPPTPQAASTCNKHWNHIWGALGALFSWLAAPLFLDGRRRRWVQQWSVAARSNLALLLRAP